MLRLVEFYGRSSKSDCRTNRLWKRIMVHGTYKTIAVFFLAPFLVSGTLNSIIEGKVDIMVPAVCSSILLVVAALIGPTRSLQFAGEHFMFIPLATLVMTMQTSMFLRIIWLFVVFLIVVWVRKLTRTRNGDAVRREKKEDKGDITDIE